MTPDFARSMIVNDLCDAMDKLVRRSNGANAYGTGLGGPDGPEPQGVSALRAPSLSQGEKK